jgi:predicted nucleic acid-binding Zn ribbon protein
MRCIKGDGTMECGNCGFLNPQGELICHHCSAAVLAKQPQRSTHMLFLLLALMISFAILEAWLLF